MSIIISKKGQNSKVLDKSDFQYEDNLQEYIDSNPESIPIYELKEDKKLYVAKREFPTNSGPIDALAFDKDGDIYIVETKLYKNPDKRTVVAQALDYGAALWKHFTDFNRFIEILNEETQNKFNLNFQEKVEDFFEVGNDELEIMIESIRDNLDKGNIKFVILMDSIDERLKDLIIYVNQNSQFDIYAVQFEYYRFEDYEIIIPKIFGVEVKKKISESGKAKQWDRTSFMEEMKTSYGITEKNISEKLLNWAETAQLEIHWGKTINPNFKLTMKSYNNEYKILTVSTEFGSRFGVDFGEYSKYPPFDNKEKRQELLNRLISIEGITISNNPTITKTTSVYMSILKEEFIFNKFIEVYEWLIKEIKSTNKLTNRLL